MYTKEIPEILFGSALEFPETAPFFAESAPFCAVLAKALCDDIKRYLDVTVIIDLAKDRFAFAPLHQSEKPELHPMTEEKGKLLLINRDGSKRNVTKLIFYPLEKFAKIESVSIKMNMFGNVQVAPKFKK